MWNLRLFIDDLLGAFAVHAGGGFWGLIVVCIFYPDRLINAIFKDANILHALLVSVNIIL